MRPVRHWSSTLPPFGGITPSCKPRKIADPNRAPGGLLAALQNRQPAFAWRHAWQNDHLGAARLCPGSTGFEAKLRDRRPGSSVASACAFRRATPPFGGLGSTALATTSSPREGAREGWGESRKPAPPQPSPSFVGEGEDCVSDAAARIHNLILSSRLMKATGACASFIRSTRLSSTWMLNIWIFTRTSKRSDRSSSSLRVKLATTWFSAPTIRAWLSYSPAGQGQFPTGFIH